MTSNLRNQKKRKRIERSEQREGKVTETVKKRRNLQNQKKERKKKEDGRVCTTLTERSFVTEIAGDCYNWNAIIEIARISWHSIHEHFPIDLILDLIAAFHKYWNRLWGRVSSEISNMKFFKKPDEPRLIIIFSPEEIFSIWKMLSISNCIWSREKLKCF